MLLDILLPLPLTDTFTYSCTSDSAVEPGFRVIVPFGSRELMGYVIGKEEERELGFEVKPIKRVVDKEPIFTSELIKLAFWMAETYLCSAGQALSIMIPSGKRESENALFSVSEDSFERITSLHWQQSNAIDRIKEKTGLYYLYGTTGSGKSEVYLRLAEQTIKQGQQVIYLVPEITLTHQLIEDVNSRFGGRVALLHSALTPSQRLKYWNMILHHEVDLIIGARSAIFAPCKKLGLIIMDEEHESTYKSGNTPRYHARQIAQYRAKHNNISLIMGSATPSLEAWNMMKSGGVTRLNLPYKVAGGKEPKIDIINMLKEQRSISRFLEDAIRKTLAEKSGVILFLNRRGYTYYYHCNSCGAVAECPNCSVALTYHKSRNRMICHYCGYSEELREECPECGSVDMSIAGFGTEKVEEEVRKLFPSAVVARLDTDVAIKDKESVKQIISDFKAGKIDILLGTQMVAKGLNFPTVKLVGVILADSTLSIPDFRSEERTYALLEQVAGRCGRYSPDGHVVIQTYRVDDNAINAVRNHSGEKFYESELEVRKLLSYPPFSRLISLTARSRKEERAKEAVDGIGELIERILESLEDKKESRIIGIQPCIIAKRSNSYRYQILLASQDIRLLGRIVNKALSLYKMPSGVYVEVDVDPLQLL